MSQLPINYDITMFQGGKWTITIELTDANDQVEDLTGFSARMDIKDRAGGNTILSLTVGSGITISIGDGKITLVVNGVQNALFGFVQAKYDLILREDASPGVNDVPIIYGDVNMIKRITEWAV
jgi:hypothetical protein